MYMKQITKYFWNAESLENLIRYLRIIELTGRYEVIIKLVGKSRSAAHNRLLWRWHTEMLRHLHEAGFPHCTTEEWHETIIPKLMPSEAAVIEYPNGVKVKTGRFRTSKAKVGEMVELLTKYQVYASEIGCYLSSGDDDYHMAMSGRK